MTFTSDNETKPDVFGTFISECETLFDGFVTLTEVSIIQFNESGTHFNKFVTKLLDSEAGPKELLQKIHVASRRR